MYYLLRTYLKPQIDIMKTAYIFDVDGTLTEPRQKISKPFLNYFTDWSKSKDLYVSTGSDFIKTKEQLGIDTLKLFKEICCCMGNEIRTSDEKIIKQRALEVPLSLTEDLHAFLNNTDYNVKTENHIELRTGMINFSIVGRKANLEQRDDYNNWDKQNEERKLIADFINKKYPLLDASIGGSISIDIIEKRKDKGQIVGYLKNKKYEKIVFYGDRCYLGGNDYGIVRELERSSLEYQWTNVSGPKQLMEFLKNEKS